MRDEFDRFMAMLDERGILVDEYEQRDVSKQFDWLADRVPTIDRCVRVHVGERRVSVVCGPFSYGGEEGLLEAWDFSRDREPEGWLTAEQAMEYVIRGEVSHFGRP